ncbi:hypothetical protein ALQ04_03557 [Pseudomonas cichorii]|uniref:CTP synthase (glutamine hydrolyzing) n=1 Tax=Pseudomonas cichorii TaxID=36746 RepID=A0A3M4LMG2_PSECI|nr:CTP synthase [Pseudomonas cichorii]RMQ42682.1 hypothetical protein ALQ04_03557 [Pseudomonas cichorii]
MLDGKNKTLRIGLAGDYDAGVIAHQAIPLALDMAADVVSLRVQHQWLPTADIGNGEILAGLDGIWCVPASPYRDMQGALTAIRFAREQQIPFLGTCGGFQHALIEYARNRLSWLQADHGETSPDSPHAIITPLSCSLVETTASIHLLPGSLIAQAYGMLEIAECYRCSYGLRPELEAAMFGDTLKISGRGPEGEIRSVELQDHPFFVATLFQPERAAMQGTLPALVAAFVKACALGSEGVYP